MEDLTEVITCAQLHPRHCNILVYGLSRGILKVADMRDQALCDKHAKCYQSSTNTEDGYFSEMISSIHDVKFSKDGRYLITRDFMSLKVWDVNMEREPLHTVTVHDHLRPKLYELYESDYLFDKFDVSIGNDDSHIISGSYHNNFFIYDMTNDSLSVLEACKPSLITRTFSEDNFGGPPTNNIDFNKKIQHIAWHPKHEQIAVASENYIYLYQQV